jgi:hypothetical protein
MSGHMNDDHTATSCLPRRPTAVGADLHCLAIYHAVNKKQMGPVWTINITDLCMTLSQMKVKYRNRNKRRSLLTLCAFMIHLPFMFLSSSKL